MSAFCCAHCLTAVEAEKRLVCSGCRRRTYCSKRCQVTDWKATGQCHKVWCKYRCGEEGIDWELRRINAEKGVGFVALKDIPKDFKIIVDNNVEKEAALAHPGIEDLRPVGGSKEDKYELNHMYGIGRVYSPFICMRLCRVNHSCSPNALKTTVPLAGKTLMSLLAIRDIQAGEEITLCYTGWQVYDERRVNAFQHKMRLKDEYNIVCPLDCACNSVAVDKAMQRATQLLVELPSHHHKRGKAGLAFVNECLAALDAVPFNPYSYAQVYPIGMKMCFDAGLSEKGLEYHKKWLDVTILAECDESMNAVLVRGLV